MSSNPFKNVTAQWLASELRKHRDACDFSERDYDGEVSAIEVRLQVFASRDDAVVHSGAPDYDTDHSGYWGSGYVGQGDTWDDLLGMAELMIDEAAEAAAQDD